MQEEKFKIANELGKAVTMRFYEQWEACQKLQAELNQVREHLGMERLMKRCFGKWRN